MKNDVGLVRGALQLAEIVWRGLVDVIVQPVGVEEICVRAPQIERQLRRIVAGEIVERHGGGKPFVRIAAVFQREGFRVVFGVSGHKDLAAAVRGDNIDAGPVAERDQLQLLMRQNVGDRNLGMARVRRIKAVVKTADERKLRPLQRMQVNAGELFGQSALR